MIDSISHPIKALKYLGLWTEDPESDNILSALNSPVKIILPIITKSWAEIVQTDSPLLIGSTLLIKVPTLPEGCGPETLYISIFFKSLKIDFEDFSRETLILPSVNLSKTLTAACISFLRSFNVKSKFAVRGAEE